SDESMIPTPTLIAAKRLVPPYPRRNVAPATCPPKPAAKTAWTPPPEAGAADAGGRVGVAETSSSKADRAGTRRFVAALLSVGVVEEETATAIGVVSQGI